MMLKVWGFLVWGLGIWGVVSICHADTPPQVWDKVRRPSLEQAWALHVKVRELLSLETRMRGRNASMRGAALERARILLEESDSLQRFDVRLRFDLGEVYEQLERHERAISVLVPSIAEYPEHPMTSDALLTLAYAYAKLGRSREERDAYQNYLSHSSEDRSRATVVLNLAEAEMHLGNIEEAIAHYHESFRLASLFNVTETIALSVWGLTVSLDRAGDPQGSWEKAKLATKLDPGEELISHHPNVFFVPAYEREWYLALGASVHARSAKEGTKEAALLWRKVEEHWGRYVSLATSDDRWLSLANQHWNQARLRRLDAEKKALKSGLK